MAHAERPTGTFDVHQLATATADLMPTTRLREWWVEGELERWLIAEGLARPNGAAGRLELTERGADLAASTAHLRYW